MTARNIQVEVQDEDDIEWVSGDEAPGQAEAAAEEVPVISTSDGTISFTIPTGQALLQFLAESRRVDNLREMLHSSLSALAEDRLLNAADVEAVPAGGLFADVAAIVGRLALQAELAPVRRLAGAPPPPVSYAKHTPVPVYAPNAQPHG